jgi:hypothetical protein
MVDEGREDQCPRRNHGQKAESVSFGQLADGRTVAELNGGNRLARLLIHLVGQRPGVHRMEARRAQPFGGADSNPTGGAMMRKLTTACPVNIEQPTRNGGLRQANVWFWAAHCP